MTWSVRKKGKFSGPGIKYDTWLAVLRLCRSFNSWCGCLVAQWPCLLMATLLVLKQADMGFGWHEGLGYHLGLI